MESKKKSNQILEGRIVVGRGIGDGGNGEMLNKGYKFPAIRGISSGERMYSWVTTMNNTVLYT